MIIIGHRGYFYEIENTIPSFIKAFELGAEGIEVDIQKTLDDKIVISHDSNLKRVFGIDFDIRKNHFNSLKKLNLKESVPTLEETLELVRDKNKFIDVEIKNQEDFKLTLELIKKFNYKDVIVSSFYHNKIFEFKNLYPEINFAYLYVHLPKNIDDYLREVQFIKPNINYLVEEYKKHSSNIIPWVVNEKDDIEFVKNFKPFGVITDFPDKFFETKSINSNISNFLKTVLKEESRICENEIYLKLINSFIDLTVEKIELNDSEIKVEGGFPINWRVGKEISLKLDNFSREDKIKYKIKEFGVIEIKIDDLFKFLT